MTLELNREEAAILRLALINYRKFSGQVMRDAAKKNRFPVEDWQHYSDIAGTLLDRIGT